MKNALMIALALASGTACAQQSELQRCRGIADKDARLACYDGIALATPAAAAPAAAVPKAVAPAEPKADTFGLERRQLKAEADAVESRIDGPFDGWGPKSVIRLANGQAWMVIDGSSAVLRLKSPKVLVRRAAMGSFMMEFEGSNETARVRRLE
ncbi:hypothetical protein PFX98_09245 [Paucibacter sediminis]|uniref:Lipoprotein n=1 Tax=Paucibacter sediminis TaxID=3019553 RepID=A0AA95NJT8_9BURK|nr:hypothetical protein [Paucibacter sp. S2-9]WIT13788.1 hypothetical protein PFX98_09245 [Paucibacter sp. S2-9]